MEIQLVVANRPGNPLRVAAPKGLVEVVENFNGKEL